MDTTNTLQYKLVRTRMLQQNHTAVRFEIADTSSIICTSVEIELKFSAVNEEKGMDDILQRDMERQKDLCHNSSGSLTKYQVYTIPTELYACADKTIHKSLPSSTPDSVTPFMIAVLQHAHAFQQFYAKSAKTL